MGSGLAARGGTASFRRAYQDALQAHLAASAPGADPARLLGDAARRRRLGVEAILRIHHLALAALSPPTGLARGRALPAARAASFLAGVLAHVPAARRAEHQALLARSLAMEARLRHLSRSLLTSHEEERMRISRELHDALSQDLTAVNLHLASLRTAAAGDVKRFRGSVERTQRLVRRSMDTVHEFARSLRPKTLDDLGLAPALRGLAQEFSRRNGLPVRVLAPREHLGLAADRRTALFRVAQEALVNVGRHARARKARITVQRTAAGVLLEVWNDGRTFDVQRVNRSRSNRHLGLLCMRERMDMVGGTFSVTSGKGSGTRVRAEVPLEAGAGA